jgi:hypothetical protein
MSLALIEQNGRKYFRSAAEPKRPEAVAPRRQQPRPVSVRTLRAPRAMPPAAIRDRRTARQTALVSVKARADRSHPTQTALWT